MAIYNGRQVIILQENIPFDSHQICIVDPDLGPQNVPMNDMDSFTQTEATALQAAADSYYSNLIISG